MVSLSTLFFIFCFYQCCCSLNFKKNPFSFLFPPFIYAPFSYFLFSIPSSNEDVGPHPSLPFDPMKLDHGQIHLYLWLFCVHILFLNFCEKHVKARTLLWFFKFGSFSKHFNTFCMSLKLSCLVLLLKFNRFWMNLLVCFKRFLVLTILSFCVGERIEGLIECIVASI